MRPLNKLLHSHSRNSCHTLNRLFPSFRSDNKLLRATVSCRILVVCTIRKRKHASAIDSGIHRRRKILHQLLFASIFSLLPPPTIATTIPNESVRSSLYRPRDRLRAQLNLFAPSNTFLSERRSITRPFMSRELFVKRSTGIVRGRPPICRSFLFRVPAVRDHGHFVGCL